MRSVLVLMLSLFAFCDAATAQLPPVPPAPPSLVGSYEFLKPDGTPFKPGHTLTLDVSIQNGVMTGIVKNDGVVALLETMTYEVVAPDVYMWTNVRGTIGMTAWNPTTQQFEDIITTGPYAGSEAILCPR
ncbi:MAG: hypothetical protein NXI31_06135 [bacterium]|nr:hypothetical protein [bacterium]